MEDLRSNPEEESLESPEAREEVESLDEATHEPGAQIEQTGDIQTAEAIEASISELTEVANENVVGTASVSMEAPDPGPHPPPELEEEESTLGTAPNEMPLEMDKSGETVGLKWDESAMVKGSEEEIEGAPINQPREIAMDEEPPHSLEADEVGSAAGLVAKEDPTPDPHPPDREGMQVLEEEAILQEAPTEMPPEMNRLESDEVVGFKFFKPVPAEEDLSAMVKGNPESTEQIKSLGGSDEEALDGKGSVAKWEYDPPPERGRDEAIGGEAPGGMPPEMNRLESDEVVGFKFFKPVPAEEDLTAWQKGEMDLQEGMSVELEGSGPEPHLGGIAKEPEFPGGADPDLSGIGKQPEGGGGGQGGGDPDLGGIGKEPDGGGAGPDPDIHKAGMDPDPVD